MNKEEFTKSFVKFMEKAQSPFHVALNAAKILEDGGLMKISETDDIRKIVIKNAETKGFYYTRDDSTLVAFIPPKNIDVNQRAGFSCVATHNDSPTLRIIQNSYIIPTKNYIEVECEPYSGPVLSHWLDRKLVAGGRVSVVIKNDKEEIINRRFVLSDIFTNAFIPSLAPHMCRGTDNKEWVPEGITKVLVPIEFINNKLTVNICGKPIEMESEKDLFITELLYKYIENYLLPSDERILSNKIYYTIDFQCAGVDITGDFLHSARLDNAASTFSAVTALAKSEPVNDVYQAVIAFDHEEIGSKTKMGAGGRALISWFSRMPYKDDNEILYSSIANSIVLSADGAHACHPTKGAISCHDPVPKISDGFCLKISHKQNYSYDDFTASVVANICTKHLIPYQEWINKTFMAGGGTIGNIIASGADVNSIDAGVPMFAMHSAIETVSITDCLGFCNFMLYLMQEGSDVKMKSTVKY